MWLVLLDSSNFNMVYYSQIKLRMCAVCVQMYLVGLSHCVVRVMWFRYCILPEAVLLSSQLFHDRLRQTSEKTASHILDIVYFWHLWTCSSNSTITAQHCIFHQQKNSLTFSMYFFFFKHVKDCIGKTKNEWKTINSNADKQDKSLTGMMVISATSAYRC